MHTDEHHDDRYEDGDENRETRWPRVNGGDPAWAADWLSNEPYEDWFSEEFEPPHNPRPARIPLSWPVRYANGLVVKPGDRVEWRGEEYDVLALYLDRDTHTDVGLYIERGDTYRPLPRVQRP